MECERINIELSTVEYTNILPSTINTQYGHPETSTTRGKTGGEPYPTLLCNTMKNANWQTRTRGKHNPKLYTIYL